MSGLRLLILFVTATAALMSSLPVTAQSTSLLQSSRHSPVKLTLEDFTKPHIHGIELPLGMDYSHETKSLVMPIDEGRRWGVGVNLDIGDAKDFNATSGLGAELKNTPGVVFQHSF